MHEFPRATAKSPVVDHGQSTWRLWVVVALWAALILQGAVAAVTKNAGAEIYPAIVMPGFNARNISEDGQAQAVDRKIEILDGAGPPRLVTAEALLAPLPANQAHQTLDRIFNESRKGRNQLATNNDKPLNVEAEIEGEVLEYLERQTERISPDSNPVGLRVTWQPKVFDVDTLETTRSGTATVQEVRW